LGYESNHKKMLVAGSKNKEEESILKQRVAERLGVAG
jgi:hypothetical protein